MAGPNWDDDIDDYLWDDYDEDDYDEDDYYGGTWE